MDVPAPFAGLIRDLHVKVGDRVSQGSRLLDIEPSANGASAGASKASAVASDGAPNEAAAPDAIGSALAAEPPPPEAAAEAPAPPANGSEPVYASPSVRRLARELGVDLSRVTGSGRKGRITKADVERLGRGEAAPAGAPGTAAALLGLDARAVAVARLREVRTGRARAPLPDSEDLRSEPGAQLGDDPPRHPQRRGRHHRARGVAQTAERGAEARGSEGDDGLVPGGRVRGRAEGVPGLQLLARRRRADPQAVLQRRLRGGHRRAGWWSR